MKIDNDDCLLKSALVPGWQDSIPLRGSEWLCMGGDWHSAVLWRWDGALWK